MNCQAEYNSKVETSHANPPDTAESYQSLYPLCRDSEEGTCSGWDVVGKRTSWIVRVATTGLIYTFEESLTKLY